MTEQDAQIQANLEETLAERHLTRQGISLDDLYREDPRHADQVREQALEKTGPQVDRLIASGEPLSNYQAPTEEQLRHIENLPAREQDLSAARTELTGHLEARYLEQRGIHTDTRHFEWVDPLEIKAHYHAEKSVQRFEAAGYSVAEYRNPTEEQWKVVDQFTPDRPLTAEERQYLSRESEYQRQYSAKSNDYERSATQVQQSISFGR